VLAETGGGKVCVASLSGLFFSRSLVVLLERKLKVVNVRVRVVKGKKGTVHGSSGHEGSEEE